MTYGIWEITTVGPLILISAIDGVSDQFFWSSHFTPVEGAPVGGRVDLEPTWVFLG